MAGAGAGMSITAPSPTVAILDRTLDGERLSDGDAVTLLRSREHRHNTRK